MLKDFNWQMQTEFCFGKGIENTVGTKLKQLEVTKVLIHHDSAQYLETTGLLQRVKDSIKEVDIQIVELGNVQPNPRLSLIYQGIELARKEKVDFVLAIGGGSVIDSAKAIGIGSLYNKDVWNFYSKGVKVEATLPVGVVLTCPATGSESSDVSVVNNVEIGEKLLVSSPLIRPRVAFMNPELTYSLPKFVTACGVADMFSHVCERYFAPNQEIGVIDRIAEGILRTLVEVGPKALKNPKDYNARAELMWIGTIAHNDTVGIGRTQDWATHVIGNELSALYDTPHGATLTIIMPSWMRYVYKQDVQRFARYASEVFGVTTEHKTLEEVALEGIDATRNFFHQLNMPTSFEKFHIPTDQLELMLNKINFYGENQCIGGIARLNRVDVECIYKMSARVPGTLD